MRRNKKEEIMKKKDKKWNFTEYFNEGNNIIAVSSVLMRYGPKNVAISCCPECNNTYTWQMDVDPPEGGLVNCDNCKTDYKIN